MADAARRTCTTSMRAGTYLNLSRKLFLHVRLAMSMPRFYLFLIFDRILGIHELRFLCWMERLSPRLMRILCGFPWPEELRQHPVLCPFDSVVDKHSIDVVPTPDFNDQQTVTRLLNDKPDMIVGLGTRILRADVLATARIGALNCHSSLLPEYRGGGTEFWQLVGGEKETGVTIHWMASRVDEGEICAQRKWTIPPRANHHRLRLMSLFYRLSIWQEVLTKLAAGDCPGIPQTTPRTRTFRRPSLVQQFEFYRRGCRENLPVASDAEVVATRETV